MRNHYQMLRWEEGSESSSGGMQISRPASTKLCSRWHHKCQRKCYHSETVKFNTTIKQEPDLSPANYMKTYSSFSNEQSPEKQEMKSHPLLTAHNFKWDISFQITRVVKKNNPKLMHVCSLPGSRVRNTCKIFILW